MQAEPILAVLILIAIALIDLIRAQRAERRWRNAPPEPARVDTHTVKGWRFIR